MDLLKRVIITDAGRDRFIPLRENSIEEMSFVGEVVGKFAGLPWNFTIVAHSPILKRTANNWSLVKLNTKAPLYFGDHGYWFLKNEHFIIEEENINIDEFM